MMFILIVDDDSIVAKSISSALKLYGYKTDIATSPSECLEKLKKDGYDMILTDIRMPKMDGIELVKHVRFTKNIECVFMTGFSEEAQRKELEIMNCRVIHKPFGINDLLKAICNGTARPA